MNYKLQGIKFKWVNRLFAYCLLPIAYCLLLSSCKDKKDSFVLDFQYDYAPVDTGHYVIYDVDSILYSFNGVQDNDTAHYQLKELAADTFYNNLNELTYRLELYRRADENSPWVLDPDRVWYTNRSTTTFFKTEDDLKFIKLVFPPEQDKEWNGNAYVSTNAPFEEFKDWVYRYENVGVPYSINGHDFDSTVSVIEVDDENAIDKRLRREVYAKGVGMIYQEWEILHIGKNAPANQNWYTGKIDGFRIRMKVREYN